MDALLVNGDEIELTPDPPWRWMVPPVKLKVSALPGHTVKAKGEFCIWESEIQMAGLLGAGQMYAAPGFDTPGSVLTVTLTVNPGTMSASVNDLKLPVAVVATTGTFIASVVPAMNPANGMPDPVVVKTGTWSIASQGQAVTKSGQPVPKQAAGGGDGSEAGSSDGASSVQDAAEEQKLHYVAIVVEDVDGNKLAAHRVSIGPPGRGWVNRTLTQSGSARVDGIVQEGEAIVQLLDSEINPPNKTPTKPWVAFTIVDEDGAPLQGVMLQVKTPDGQELKMQTGAKGAVRIPLASEGECEVLLVAMADGPAIANVENLETAEEMWSSPTAVFASETTGRALPVPTPVKQRSKFYCWAACLESWLNVLHASEINDYSREKLSQHQLVQRYGELDDTKTYGHLNMNSEKFVKMMDELNLQNLFPVLCKKASLSDFDRALRERGHFMLIYTNDTSPPTSHAILVYKWLDLPNWGPTFWVMDPAFGAVNQVRLSDLQDKYKCLVIVRPPQPESI